MRSVLRRLTARAVERLPEHRWREFAALRSHLGQGPAIVAPTARRALVVAPHPDDETLVCGGTVARLVATGAAVTVVVATSGEASLVDLPRAEVARRRDAEVRAACAELGVEDVRHLGLPDGGLLDETSRLRDALASVVAECDPELVLLPWFGDAHPDHRAVNQALAEVELTPAIAVWGGETWTPVPATVLVDTTAVIDRKLAAVRAHVTAARAFDLEAMVALDRYRSVHGLRGRGYAEAFLALSASGHREAVARWRGIDGSGRSA